MALRAAALLSAGTGLSAAASARAPAFATARAVEGILRPGCLLSCHRHRRHHLWVSDDRNHFVLDHGSPHPQEACLFRERQE